MAEQPRYALEVALLKGVFLAPGAEVSELIARLEELAAAGGPAAGPTGTLAPRTPTETPTATPTATPTPAPTPAERAVAAFGTPGCAVPGAAAAPPPGAGAWRALVEQAEQASPVVGQVLRQAVLLRLSEGEVAIQVAPGLAAQTAERRRGEIEAVLERHFGRPTRLAVTASAAPPPEAAGGASLAQVEREEREARSVRVRDAARSHANIREAAQILGADVAKVDEL
jgi:DNA polymerase-3 subunit gamma/tau